MIALAIDLWQRAVHFGGGGGDNPAGGGGGGGTPTYYILGF